MVDCRLMLDDDEDYFAEVLNMAGNTSLIKEQRSDQADKTIYHGGGHLPDRQEE